MRDGTLIGLVVLGVIVLGLGSAQFSPDALSARQPGEPDWNMTDNFRTHATDTGRDITQGLATVSVGSLTPGTETVSTGGSGGTPEHASITETTTTTGNREDSQEFSPWSLSRLIPIAVFLSLIVGTAVYFIRNTEEGAESEESVEEIDSDDAADDDEENDEAVSQHQTGLDEAADQLATGDAFENDVVRAWSTFVDRIEGVARATATPGEIQRAAIDAGDPPDAVRTLTETFNDVRYGAVDPERHRTAASAALRTIAEQDAAAGERASDDQETPKGGTGDGEDDDRDRSDEDEEDDHR